MLTVMHLAFTAHATVAFEITGKNSSVGVLSFAIGLALLVTTPLSGTIADRLSKRLLMLFCQALFIVMAVLLAVLLYADALTIGIMSFATFLFGCGVSFFWPAITAWMGDVVEPDKQANGAALFQIALNLTRSFAPFVGAALLSWDAIGLGGSYIAVTGVMVLAVASVAFIPKPKPRDSHVQRGSVIRDIRQGVAHVAETPALRVAMTSFIVVILLAFSIMIVLPGYAKDVLGAGDAGFGIMFGTHAIGGLVAGLFVASKAASPHLNRLLFLSSLFLGVTISATALAPNFALGLVGIFLVGAGAGAFQTLIMAAILRASAPEYFGRVVALTNIGWALNNLCGLILGVVADVTSERAALFGLGVLLSIVAILLALWAQRVLVTPEAAAREAYA
jgi:predicted MFS family arabinose efflux permease